MAIINGTTGIDKVQSGAVNENGTLIASPVGSVVYFPSLTIPSGYLKANGATISRTTYANLFAVIGTAYGVGNGSTTFTLPDLRGEFIRGVDDSRGVDAGRVIGTAQGQTIQSHDHTVHLKYGATLTAGGTGVLSDSNGGTSFGAYSSSATGGTETRPRNVALLACIKY
jgi:microcystin-dependent protein